MEWVEVAGKTVEDAIKAGLQELDISSREEAEIEILQEPKAGFLGIGAQLAHVKVSPKSAEPQRKRRRRRKRGSGASQPSESQQQSGDRPDRSTSERANGGKAGKKEQSGGKQQPAKSDRRRSGGSQDGRQDRGKAAAMKEDNDGRPEATIEERAEVAATFIRGLLDAFGLEGNVDTEIEDDILKIEVSGVQTEALVGPKGSVMQAVLEITRTVIQRKTYGAPRIRLDIAGYAERRREALKIYAGKLADKVLSEGGEVMLEPMNPADRKVIHDAVSEIDGVRSFSEGEDPERAVVLAPGD